MFLTMGIGLYTSRLVLDALGIVDYGIYGLVGGVVSMFTFLNSAMASATQRYLSFDIGKDDQDKLQKTFNATINIHFLIAFVVFLLAETLGLWFVNHKLDIPADRLYAANWVYQFSILAFVTNVVQVPYNALLFAREHLSIYAYVSILETFLKLLIVLYLIQASSDKLILYGILTFVVAFVIRLVYKVYCKKHFKESVYKFYWNKVYYKELLSYSVWNLFGNLASVVRSQGSNILLNIFFGPVVNAAYGITNIVQGVMSSFVSNFQIAVNPQIVKSYSRGDLQISLNLMYKSAKFSFFGMLVFIVPFLVNIEFVMNLWLKEIPPYSIEFIRLALISSLIETLAYPLIAGAQASGKIKWYQITISIFIFLIFPTAYIVFKTTNNPIDLFLVFIGSSVITLILRLLFLQKMMSLNLTDFGLKVCVRLFIVTSLIFVLIKFIPFSKPLDFINFIAQSILLVFLILMLILIFGMTTNERNYCIDFVKYKLLRIK